MYRKKLIVFLSCGTMAMAMSLCGCSKKKNTDSQDSKEVKGVISSISDDEVTLMVMDDILSVSEPPQGEAPQEEPPEEEVPEGEAPQGEAPQEEPPEGEAPQGEAPEGEAPQGEAPEGEAPQGEALEDETSQDDLDSSSEEEFSTDNETETKEDGNKISMSGEEITYSINDDVVFYDSDGKETDADDFIQGDFVTATVDSDGTITELSLSNNMEPGGGHDSENGADIDYQAVLNLTEDTKESGKTYESIGDDEEAVLVSKGANVTLSDVTVKRISDSSTGGDNSSFYGVGAAMLVTDGSLNLEGGSIDTDSAGGAGVFAYGDGTINISDVNINTKKDTSGGIHVAGGGTINASNLSVTTEGESSAAIRSDRGGGNITVTGGKYTSNGTGSPAIYCTADISVSDAELTATNSEGICIEGKNTINLKNSQLTCNMPENEQNDCTWSVILYQSMSGDSEIGSSEFSMEDGSISSQNGGIFYTTNTSSVFNISNVEITSDEDREFFLKATGNSNKRGWGESGSNGAKCTFNAVNQNMDGDIIYDSISTLDINMSEKSVLSGAVIDDETNAGQGGDGYCNLTISEDSTWIVTGDSQLDNLSCAGIIKDGEGKTVTIKENDGTVYIKGDSPYSISMESYSNSVK